MAANTNFLGSGLTTQFTGSDVSFAGQLYGAGAARLASTLSVVGATTLGTVTLGAGTVSSVSATGAIAGTNIRATSSVAIGGSSTSLIFVSASSTSIMAATVNATNSTTTTTSHFSVQLGDIILTGPSTLSENIILQAYASANSTISLRYSNVSAANVAQTQINCRYIILRAGN